MKLDAPVSLLKGVGSELAKKLAAQGITTVGQLLEYYPRRYDDYSVVTPIAQLRPGPVSLKAVITNISGRYVRRGLHITEAIASDETGSVRLVWFNQPYRAQATKLRQEYFISGQFELSYQRLSVMNPSLELVSDFPLSAARIVPIYRESKNLKSLQIRRVLKSALPAIRDTSETLPAWLVAKQSLISRAAAVEKLHFPNNPRELEAARARLGFEEVFELTLAALINKEQQKHEHALKIPFKENLARKFVASLPFKLTGAQRRVVWQTYQDMKSDQPMNRLVEGDVGAGKTAVAAMAALMVMKNGFQVALMAPTELLARQHADTIFELLKPLGLNNQISLLVGSLKPAQKTAAHKKIKSGDIKFIIGTHALIQQKVDMHKLGLIIIDEQHRFGVDQRKKLQAKAGHMPHVLSLTATPIPRSLALTLYGELDISVLDELPPGRRPVKTRICSPNSRPQLYKQIDKVLAAGQQMFVVCPLIAPTSTLSVVSAEKTYEALVQGPFKHRKIGLLHGRLKAETKELTMRKFVEGQLDILVATTVIEVGVDVPKATIMLIEGAERFGLAQIHQLRGRVGRRGQQAYCFLMMSDSSAPSRRLHALQALNDGFKLAELDLALRGPGAIYGTLQHGQLDLRVAKLSDVKLIATARRAAEEFLKRNEDLPKYAHLATRVNNLRAITNLN